MGAVEHLKTLCCLGLPPERARVAVGPVLHEIIPHGWTRLGLVAPDATMGSFYAEHPAAAALFKGVAGWRTPITAKLRLLSIPAGF